jgi:hypothetical protein
MDWVTTLSAGLGQIVFFLDKAIQGFQDLLAFDFNKLGSIVGNYGADYSDFVASQNAAAAPRASVPPGRVSTPAQAVTINVNKGNVTAKEIANAVNKGAKVGGAPILTGTALRQALR